MLADPHGKVSEFHEISQLLADLALFSLPRKVFVVIHRILDVITSITTLLTATCVQQKHLFPLENGHDV